MQTLAVMLNRVNGGRPMALGDTIAQRLKGCPLRAEGLKVAARSVDVVPRKVMSLVSRQELTNARADKILELKLTEAQKKLGS